MTNCPGAPCPICNGRTIYLTARGRDESSSTLGQYVHDQFPPHMDWIDIDAAAFARSTRILRVFEHKYPRQSITDAQRDILPLFAHGIDLLVDAEVVARQSGVFVVRWPIGDDRAIGEFQRVLPNGDIDAASVADPTTWRALLMARPHPARKVA